MLYGLTYMSHLKNKTNKKTKLIGTENRLKVTRVGGEMGQKVQISSYKINKSQG